MIKEVFKFTGDRGVIWGGFDIGNNQSKAAFLVPLANGKWGLVLKTLPSRVCQGIPEMYQNNDEVFEKIIHVVEEDRDIDYIVNAPVYNPTGSLDYQFSPERGALAYALATSTLAEIYPDIKKPIVLQSGATMMIGLYYEAGRNKSNDKIERLQRTIAGHNFSLGGKTWPQIIYKGQVAVVAETLAAVAGTLIGENGVPRETYDNGEKIVAGQKVAIFDVGWRDTTGMVVHVGSHGIPIMDDYQTTYDISIEANVANVLETMVRVKMQGDKHRVEDNRMLRGVDLLQLDSYRCYKTELDLKPLKRKAMTALTSQLKGFISKLIGGGNDCAAIVIVGGYVPLAQSIFGMDYFLEGGASKLSTLNNLMIPESPEYANAIGALATLTYRANNITK